MVIRIIIAVICIIIMMAVTSTRLLQILQQKRVPMVLITGISWVAGAAYAFCIYPLFKPFLLP